MRFLPTVLFVVFVCTPCSVRAAVVINEIAWMGTATSANDEWIELHNNGLSPTALDDWVLTDNVSLVITLAGTIPAGGYAVLERTDDSSAPGAAFLLYTGALSNSGGTLTLTRADGSIEDQIAGGSNWESIGGDNVTKETAQRTDSGWITAIGTPGAQNATLMSVNTDIDDNGSKESKSSSGGGAGSTQKELPAPVQSVRIVAPAIAYVHQPVQFDVIPSGSGDRLVRYFWNFGDGILEESKDPVHSFAHAGDYVVVVRSRYLGKEAIARVKLTVLPPALSLARTELGAVQIHNDAQYEIDLGAFVVRGEKEFVIPKHTILLPRATLTVHRKLLESGPRNMVSLHDPAGVTLATMLAHQTSSKQETDEHDQSLIISTPQVEAAVAPVSAEFDPIEAYEIPETPMVYRPAQVAAVVEAEKLPLQDMLPYLGLVGVLSLGILGVYLRKMA